MLILHILNFNEMHFQMPKMNQYCTISLLGRLCLLSLVSNLCTLPLKIQCADLM